MLKKITWILLAAMCVGAPAAWTDGSETPVVVLYTSDVLGHLEPCG